MRSSPQINPDDPSTGHVRLLLLPLIRPNAARPTCLANHLIETPETVLLRTTKHPAPAARVTHALRDTPVRQVHPLRYVICFGCFVPSERPLHPLVRISDPLGPRLLLPTRTPAHVLQTRRTVQRQCRAPEDVQSRFGRHPTYQRHASSINRILPEAFTAISQAFHSLRGFVIPHR